MMLSLDVTRPWWLYAALAVTTAIVLWLVVRLVLSDSGRSMRAKMALDAADPYKRWVQAAFTIVTGDCDYAYLGRAEARHLLIKWWNVHGPIEHAETLRSLAQPNRPDNAWDLLRFIIVARLGVGAGLSSNEESWNTILPIARRLQDSYVHWRSMARAYLLARRQWQGVSADGSEDDAQMRTLVENIADLQDSVWSEIDFQMDLAPSQGDDLS